jgi:hypothetical protein
VWIALYKENSTYGEWMPNSMFKPEAEQDTFVLTNIRMPNEYILKAEKKLDEQILTYMEQNNVTGYNFDIKFSRIFLEQEKEYTNTLSENARLIVEYQGGKERAKYGDRLIERLSIELTKEYGGGFDKTNLRRMRCFYECFPIRDSVRLELNWTHYRYIMRVDSLDARDY